MLRRIIHLRNNLAELERAAQEVRALLEAQGLSPDLVHTANLGLEEVITNILKYGYDNDGTHQIEIALLLTPAELQLVVADDGHEFDPLQQAEPDTAMSAQERQPGGLGIYFLRKLFDAVEYRREAERNFLTMRKNLSEMAR